MIELYIKLLQEHDWSYEFHLIIANGVKGMLNVWN